MEMSKTVSRLPTEARRSSRFRARKVVTFVVLVVILTATSGLISQAAMWKARVAIEQRQHVDAEKWLQVASWTWRRSAEWYYLTAVLQRRNGDFSKLEVSLRAAFAKGWNVADLERQQLLAMAQSDQFEEVDSQWAVLLQNAGSDGPEICKSFVNYCLSRFQIADAYQVIEAWKRDFPEDPEVWYVEGRILIVLQRWPDAERTLTQALERDPNHLPAMKQLSVALIKQFKFAEAEKILRRADVLNPESAETQASLAHCLIQQGQTDDAEAMLAESLIRHPADVSLLAEDGRLQLALGHPDKAVGFLEKVVEQQPENTELRYSLAQALRSAGKEEEAQRHFRIVDEGTKALLQLSRLTAQVVEDPSNTDLRYQVAAITWKWKSRTDGEAWLRSILEYDPKHKDANAMLAEHYQILGRSELAEEHRRIAGEK